MTKQELIMVQDKEYRKRHHKENKAWDNERNKQWYENNINELRKKHREYYYDNKETFLQKQSERRDTESYKLRHAEYMRERNRRIRIELINFLGGCCSAEGCGITDIRCLQIDHKMAAIGNHYSKRNYRVKPEYYIKRPELAKKELQVLCANHNIIKTIENHERRLKIYS